MCSSDLIEEVKKQIRDVYDFPEKGIVFKDLTTAFKDAACMSFFENEMYRLYKDKGITKVIGIESRGFIMAPILGNKLGVGFVPIRKKGKLPAETYEVSYGKEYGKDVIQIHKDSLCADDIVLIHDDLLATGGTMKAACDLVKIFGVKKIYVNFLVELDFLKGIEVFDKDIDVLIGISNFQTDQDSNNQFQTSLHFIEIISEDLGVDKSEVYVNTSAATDGAILKVGKNFYRAMSGSEPDKYLLEKIDLHKTTDIEIVEVEK